MGRGGRTMVSLTRRQVEDLCSFVENRIAADACDHTHRFSRAWAESTAVDWDDLLDLLEGHGSYCDCEVVTNLPEEIALTTKVTEPTAADGDPWRLPKASNDPLRRAFSR